MTISTGLYTSAMLWHSRPQTDYASQSLAMRQGFKQRFVNFKLLKPTLKNSAICSVYTGSVFIQSLRSVSFPVDLSREILVNTKALWSLCNQKS